MKTSQAYNVARPYRVRPSSRLIRENWAEVAAPVSGLIDGNTDEVGPDGVAVASTREVEDNS